MKSLTNILDRIKLTKEDISGMIRDAKKEKVTDPGEVVQDTISEDPFTSLEAFTSFITGTYLVTGQKIEDLSNFYRDTVDNSDLRKFINNPPNKNLSVGSYPMTDIEKKLYYIINKDVIIPNGHPSELWFAIVFNGKVTGAVGKSTPDIEVGSETVSLKSYDTATFDFGKIDKDSAKLLSVFISLSNILTSVPIDPAQLSRIDINNSLNLLESDIVKQHIKEILKLGESPSIPPPIKTLALQIERLLNSDNPNDLHNLVVKFCNEIDDLLKRKISSANWWGLIIKGNSTLFLESADGIYEKSKCKNNRLSNAIANFKGWHLWINGTQLETAVTTRKSKG
jgi:hypothetical protein